MSEDRQTVTIPREVYHFLMGEGPLEGMWFDDLNSGLPGKYWWRGILRSAAGWLKPRVSGDEALPEPPRATDV